ncbi:MAG TPA: allantoinase AllB [Candidatus Baltobacterales bacterium]|nr:allantoinase AllB [Candidatus Baltobacterales bacterium]
MIIRGGTVVTARGVDQADIEVTDGLITAVGMDLGTSADGDIDATGLHVFPGGIDSHVHFNEPGRTDWETIANGSAALAAGGYTTFIDMPLNSLPVTVAGPAFDAKLAAMRRSSIVDFGLWAGLVPGNMSHLAELVERGAMGFKAFMCPSGIEEFPACDARALREGMKRISDLGSILLVHAESPDVLNAYAREGLGAGAFLASRPPLAEFQAIDTALGLAAEAGCRLHVVHVSTARGVQLVRAAQARGVHASAETCPHYLLYADSDLERLGGWGKCTPPLRSARDREALWNLLGAEDLAMVVSDHSPSTPQLKQGTDFFRIWGGISGCQSTRQLLLAEDKLELTTIAAVTATNVARRFGLVGKGDVAPGFDADLWLVDLDQEDVVRREDLLYLNPFSVHEGRTIRGKTVRTLVRGRTAYPGGGAAGQFIRPGVRS